VDAAYFEDLAGRRYGLLIMLEDRIDREQAGLLHEFIEAGEYGLALEEIAGTLAQDTAAITHSERGGMLALAGQMEIGDLVSRALAFCPRLLWSRSGAQVRACGNGGSGRTSAAAAGTSQPARPAPAADVKVSHAMASASATSAAATASTTVTRT
jgi:hypothetical protein